MFASITKFILILIDLDRNFNFLLSILTGYSSKKI